MASRRYFLRLNAAGKILVKALPSIPDFRKVFYGSDKNNSKETLLPSGDEDLSFSTEIPTTSHTFLLESQVGRRVFLLEKLLTAHRRKVLIFWGALNRKENHERSLKRRDFTNLGF